MSTQMTSLMEDQGVFGRAQPVPPLQQLYSDTIEACRAKAVGGLYEVYVHGHNGPVLVDTNVSTQTASQVTEDKASIPGFLQPSVLQHRSTNLAYTRSVETWTEYCKRFVRRHTCLRSGEISKAAYESMLLDVERNVIPYGRLGGGLSAEELTRSHEEILKIVLDRAYRLSVHVRGEMPVPRKYARLTVEDEDDEDEDEDENVADGKSQVVEPQPTMVDSTATETVLPDDSATLEDG